MTTYDLLLAKNGHSPFMPLVHAAPLWGCMEETLAKKIDRGEVRLPYFRADDSQKSPRMVSVKILASLLDRRHDDAVAEFEKSWA